MKKILLISALLVITTVQTWGHQSISSTGSVAASSAIDRGKVNSSESAKRLLTKLGLSGPLFGGSSAKIGAVPARWVPGGRFLIGSNAVQRGLQTNENHREVRISDGFFMAETECRQSEWEAVMGSNPSRFKGANHPVEEVTWNQAVEYCKRLTEVQQREGILTDGWEWRLPTEAEWEYATRAGTKTPRHGEVNEVAWWENNSDSQTHPVGQKLPNAWGLYDTLGNVWEWCFDRYTPLGNGISAGDMTEIFQSGGDLGGTSTSSDDPLDPALSSARVVRGGSWDNGEYDCRSARRTKVPEALHYDNLGFRPILAQKRGLPIGGPKPRAGEF
jgi:formylglycine-generating enzyme required for sulfatase activity